MPQRSQIMLLGTYHMANPGMDYANIAADDVLSPYRQEQINQCVKNLAAFQPTKIGVEAVNATALQESYRSYCQDIEPLNDNEIQQIGFRLARMLKHNQLYPIDWQGIDLDFANLITFANEHGQNEQIDAILAQINHFTEQTETLIQQQTISNILRTINDPAAIARSHLPYTKLACISTDSVYPGAQLVANWYHRNLVIYANICRMNLNACDRVLIIIGAGHVPILSQLFIDSQAYEVVSPLEYL